jgi:hypothetical protein
MFPDYFTSINVSIGNHGNYIWPAPGICLEWIEFDDERGEGDIAFDLPQPK